MTPLPALLLLLITSVPLAGKLPPDLEARLSQIESERGFDIFRDREVARLIDQAAGLDESALRARLLRMPAGSARLRALRLLGKSLGSQPEKALEFLAEVPAEERPGVAEATFEVLASRPTLEAMALADRLPDVVSRQRARLSVALALARTDPLGAVGLVADLPSSQRARVWRAAAEAWPLTDARGLLRWAAELPGATEPERVSVVSAWAFRLCRERPDLARRALPMLPDEIRPMFCRMVSRRAAPGDLAGTLAWMSGLPNLADRSEALLGLLNVWVLADLDSARLAVETWPDTAAQGQLHGLLAWEWSKRDSMAAVSWAATLDTRLRPEALYRAVNQLAYQDQPSARRTLMGLPAGPERDKLVERFVSSRSATSELAAWAAAYPDAATARRLVRRAVFGWCVGTDERTVGAAESWVLALGDAALREEALLGALDGSVSLILGRNRDLDPDVFLRLIDALDSAPARREQAARVDELWRRAYPDDPRRPFARLLEEQGEAEPKVAR